MSDEPIVIFTDGAAARNPGPGGWGALVAVNGSVFEIGGFEPATTNNRMEMIAAIAALRLLEAQTSQAIVVYTDSSYVEKGITAWIHGWKRRGWLKADGEPVLNKDLWIDLEAAAKGRRVSWRRLKGHAGIPGNERADRIAADFARSKDVELYAGSEADYPVADFRKVPAPRASSSKRSKTGRGKAHAYISLVGDEWRRHATWSECERRVKGVGGARFKKVMSEGEIGELLESWGVRRPD